MKNKFLDNDKLFLIPNHKNSAISALSAINSQLNFNTPINRFNYYSKDVEKLFLEKKGNSIKNLIIVLADSFGTENLRETSIFSNELEANLEVDCMFPSMTTTNMTSLSHISSPATHGMVGHNIFHEKLGRIVNTINMKTIDTEGTENSLSKLGFKKKDIIFGISSISQLSNHAKSNEQTFYSELYYPHLFEPDGLAQYLFEDIVTKIYPDSDPSPAIKQITQSLQTPRSDIQLFIIYFPHTDYYSHYYTAQSIEYLQAVKLLYQIVQALTSHPSFRSGNSSLILTSDHGQVTLPKGRHRKNFTFNDVKLHNQAEFSIGSSGRVLHVYYETDRGMKNAETFLETHFNNSSMGIILDQKEAGKLLGKNPTQVVLNRLGQKVVIMGEKFYLDYPEVAIMTNENKIVAQHGGLSQREIKVPFLIY